MPPALTYIIVIALAAFVIFVPLFTGYQIFIHTLYRNDKRRRTRECTDNSIAGQKEMFRQGIEWREQRKDRITELHLVSDGLNLYGEYMDLGFDRCAVIIQGRTESLLYSYYFADAYARAGYNILTYDTRAHGLSDGKYITAGVTEYRDLLKWIDLIKERFAIKSFTVHGVCIGGATAVYAYCASKDKGLIKKLVTDGLFVNYYDIFRRHMTELKKPVLFFVHLTFLYARLCSGASIMSMTPYKSMPDIDIPILFIWSVKDNYCAEENNKRLFDACASSRKEIALFPEGRHSFVRYCNTEAYDRTLAGFLARNDD